MKRERWGLEKEEEGEGKKKEMERTLSKINGWKMNGIEGEDNQNN